MYWADVLRLLLFLFAVGAVYAAAARSIVRSIRDRRSPPASPPRRIEVWTRRVSLPLAAFGLACAAYGYFIEPVLLEVSRVQIGSARLPSGSLPIRIVHLSDIHSDPTSRLEPRIPEVVAAEKPGLIVFTGDAINDRRGLPHVRSCLARLAELAPAFGVRGNWDALRWGGVDLFAGTGVRELNGEAVKVDIGGTPVWVAGAPPWREDLFDRALAAVPPGAFTVFLYHYPDALDVLSNRGVGLVCSGHTHGGQVALPGYGALVTLARTGKQYEAGLYRKANTWMYVNRGIGMEGGFLPRVRFCARPEVTVIDMTN
jgi:predicted MPP superfamily phosphohydrolase